jgi:hypothetical protein
MVTWAKDEPVEAEINAYNKAMNGKRHQRHEARGRWSQGPLHRSQRHRAQAAQWRQRSGLAGAGDVFRSNAELTTAMKDPRYATDPAYREDVAKLGRSNIM